MKSLLVNRLKPGRFSVKKNWPGGRRFAFTNHINHFTNPYNRDPKQVNGGMATGEVSDIPAITQSSTQ